MKITKTAFSEFVKAYIDASKKELGLSSFDEEYLLADATRAWKCLVKLKKKGIV